MTDVSPTSEAALRALAKALAPFLLEELRELQAIAEASLSPEFDMPTCERFAAELGDGVLDRARTLFEALDRDGIIDSLALAEALGVTPRGLSGYLTTPLKRRSSALRLPLPFSGGLGAEPYGGIPTPSPDMDPQRTHWQDRDGIAKRMLRAIVAERGRRLATLSASQQAQAKSDHRSF